MAIRDAQPDDSGSKPVIEDETPKTHRAFDRITRELSDEELDSTGARKLLLDRLAQAEDQVAILNSFRARFHEADKQNGVFEEKLRTTKSHEAISIGCLAVGGAALGYAKNLWSYQPAGWIALASGVVLIGAGIVAKVIRK